jgi:hypothetical protein
MSGAAAKMGQAACSVSGDHVIAATVTHRGASDFAHTGHRNDLYHCDRITLLSKCRLACDVLSCCEEGASAAAGLVRRSTPRGAQQLLSLQLLKLRTCTYASPPSLRRRHDMAEHGTMPSELMHALLLHANASCRPMSCQCHPQDSRQCPLHASASRKPASVMMLTLTSPLEQVPGLRVGCFTLGLRVRRPTLGLRVAAFKLDLRATLRLRVAGLVHPQAKGRSFQPPFG